MKARSAFLLLALVLVLLVPPSALAQATLLSDDFGAKPLASWQASPLGLFSNWDASSGAAVYNGGGHTQIFAGGAGSSSWTDYTFQVKVKLANGSDYPGGIRGRIDVATGAGYAAWLYPAEGVVKLFRSTAWQIDTAGLTLLSQASISGGITSGVLHTLALSFSGSQISVAFDGTTVIQATDTTLTAGTVALDVSNQPITYDDVAVTSSTTTLFADDFSPRPLRNWTPSPLGLFNNWDASTGVAAYNGGGHTQIWAGNGGWTNYTVEGKFRLANASNYPGGLRGRVNTATGESYAAWLYPGDGVVKLFRVVAWNIDTTGLTLVSQANVGTITTGVFHKLAITFNGARISVALDGTGVIQASDSTYTAGAVALDTSNQPIGWDDVKVTALPPADQLFADDFSSLTLVNWTASPLGLFSNWSASGGTAAYNGGGHTQIYAGSALWTDYKVAAKFRLANASNYPGGLRGRVNTSTGESYAAWIYPGNGVIKLFRAAAWNIDTPGLAVLAQANVGTITANAFHNLSITFVGNQIKVNYDGTDVIQTTDTVLSAGAVALDVSNQPIEWDDVVVTAQTAPPPPPLFFDDFSGGLAHWTASPLGLFANWSGAAGTASYNGGGHTQIYAGSNAWTNYKLEAKVRLANASNFPGGIRGRVNTSTGESYAAWLYPENGVVKLLRAAAWNIDTPGLAVLAQANVGTIAPNVFHTLSLTLDGSRISVAFNGTTVIQVTDTVLSAGAIALDVSTQPIEFDDVVVTQLGGGNPPPPPPDDNGPGGPILVISKATNPFTRYAGEILLAEGLNQYAIKEIGTLDAATLANYDVAILGETALTAAQVTLLTDWVNAGGRLIALRPDAQLAALLGITPANQTLANGYLLINTAAAPGQGLVNETIQFHGTADLYTLSGATAIATLYSNATTATTSPAVTLKSVGSSGGKAAAFAYDLGRSVVYTRQGNPAWAGQERDGITPKRSDDLFFGNAASDPQTDWIDLTKVAIPQADEQQRLLANLILTMNAGRKPLPRFWYLPRGLKAAVVMTGDDHGNNGTQGRFQGYEATSPAGCSVANWECVRATSYIYTNTPLPPSAALAFQAEGFEVAVHLTSLCADWTTSSLESFFASQLSDFATLFPGISTPVTNRTHCIAWSDWATEPKTEKAHGIRFDTNYYYWPGSWIQDRPGFFTGSGLPMRFADLDGTRIDVYQATTQMTDESGQSFPFNIDTLLDNALGTKGYYGVMTANMHTDSPTSSGSDAIVASAQARGVPIVSSKQMLTWLDGRNGSSFSNHSRSGNALSFTITAATGANGLQALLPNASPAGTLASLTLNGSPVTFTTQTIKGLPYAVFPAASGSYVATYTP